MNIADFKDNLMLAKDSIGTEIRSNPVFGRSAIPAAVNDVTNALGLADERKRVFIKSGTSIIVTDKAVVRLPMDRENTARCRHNKIIINKLARTGISRYIPKSLSEGMVNGQRYYSETRLPGTAIDLPISRLDEMVDKAANLITEFHKETARDIAINEANYRRLFGTDFSRLYPYLNKEYREKLAKVEDRVKKDLMGKPFKTVWMHGDYKLENILFDTKTWQIKGVIDWDLSRREGLPLLDILYLLLYRQYTETKRSVIDLFKEKIGAVPEGGCPYFRCRTCLDALGISADFMKPLLVAFFLHHVTVRYGVKGKVEKNVCEFIERIGDVNV